MLLNCTTTALDPRSIWRPSLTPAERYLADARTQADPGEEQTACASRPVTGRPSAPALASSRAGRSARAARPVASPSFAVSRGARAAEFEHVFVASSNLRMHHDVTSNSFGADELTAALPLRQELEHLRAPRSDWWDGRAAPLSPDCRLPAKEKTTTAGASPSGATLRAQPWLRPDEGFCVPPGAGPAAALAAERRSAVRPPGRTVALEHGGPTDVEFTSTTSGPWAARCRPRAAYSVEP